MQIQYFKVLQTSDTDLPFDFSLFLIAMASNLIVMASQPSSDGLSSIVKALQTSTDLTYTALKFHVITLDYCGSGKSTMLGDAGGNTVSSVHTREFASS